MLARTLLQNKLSYVHPVFLVLLVYELQCVQEFTVTTKENPKTLIKIWLNKCMLIKRR